ncbi:MAG: DUF1501 domain-containing protein [Bryobacteraceae bacterium]
MLIKTRRDFLRIGLGSIPTAATIAAMGKLGELNVFAAGSSNYQALVCVFLAGGNDGNNMVAPLNTATQNYTTYATARQTLALPQSQFLPIAAKNGDQYGLDSQMPEIQALYQSGKAAIAVNVGMLVVPIPNAATYNSLSGGSSSLPVNLFSHSDQTTQWQTTSPTETSPTGWGGRLADQMQSLNTGAQFPTVVTTSGLAAFCTGAQTLPSVVPPGGAVPVTGNGSDAARINAFQQLLTFDNGLQLVQQANGIVSRGAAYVNVLNGLLASATPLQTQFPAGNPLAAQLNMVARIIGVHAGLGLNRQIFFCSLDGFDTHGSQISIQTPLLQQLSQALNAFDNATVELGVAQQVTSFTSSEFGRTLMANSSGGTDHAWGNHHLIVGGSVAGGDLYGTYPTLTLGNATYDATGRGSMIPGTSVDQYGATFAQWFGVAPANLPQIFPNIGNFTNNNLGFMG